MIRAAADLKEFGSGGLHRTDRLANCLAARLLSRTWIETLGHASLLAVTESILFSGHLRLHPTTGSQLARYAGDQIRPELVCHF